jgi:hypothetical protein
MSYGIERNTRRKPFTPRDVKTPGLIKKLEDPRMGSLATHYKALRDLIGDDVPFWIAGGAITSLFTDDKVNDWDVFTSDPANVIHRLNCSNARRTFENGHVVNFTHDSIGETIQVINKKFKTAADTASLIDLTINAAAFDGKALYVHEDFVDDLEDTRIGLNVVDYPLSTLNRIIKYSRRGFDLRPDVLVTIVDLVRKAEIPDLNNLSFYITHEGGYE